jgi:hypothetical protein
LEDPKIETVDLPLLSDLPWYSCKFSLNPYRDNNWFRSKIPIWVPGGAAGITLY